MTSEKKKENQKWEKTQNEEWDKTNETENDAPQAAILILFFLSLEHVLLRTKYSKIFERCRGIELQTYLSRLGLESDQMCVGVCLCGKFSSSISSNLKS